MIRIKEITNATIEKSSENYEKYRYETLIDLNKIPKDIHDDILREFKNMKTADRGKLFDYFVKKKLNKLMQNIGDF